MPRGSAVLVLTLAVSACTTPSVLGAAAVPNGRAALLIADRLCPSVGSRRNPWHIALTGGVWTLWRFDGSATIRIDAETGDTGGCQTN